MEKRVACYARTSTLDQKTGLESQVRVLRTYCDQNEIKDALFFTDDGVSGTKSSRPALDQLMAAVDRDEISSVVVHSFSRFARSTTHLLNALTRFKEKKVHFASISERIDTNSPVGVAIFSILAAIAQLERDLIAMRVKIGLENARAKGKQIGRKKLRNSVLIRELLKAGMSFRKISMVAKCSHGSVSAEKKSMLYEEEMARQKLEAQAAAAKNTNDSGVIFPAT